MTKKVELIRRTKTIEETIRASSNITQHKLGRTRSQTGVQKRIVKVPAATHKNAPVVKKAVPVVRKEKVGKLAKKTTTTALKRGRPHSKPTTPPPTAATTNPTVTTMPILDGIPIYQQNHNHIAAIAKPPRKTDSRAASVGVVDVVFCVDTTSSMSSYLAETKAVVRTIVTNIRKCCRESQVSVRFGFVCYRDHPPQDNTYVTKVQDLCSDDEVLRFIEQQNAQGGGDFPEAVLDGLLAAAKEIQWRDSRTIPSLRYIFHIADAPPHGQEFGYTTSNWNNGVPSGVTLNDVVHAINIREIHYRLINLGGTTMDKMVALFKANFTDYDETTLAHAKELNIKISDMIIHELLPDVDYN